MADSRDKYIYYAFLMPILGREWYKNYVIKQPITLLWSKLMPQQQNKTADTVEKVEKGLKIGSTDIGMMLSNLQIYFVVKDDNELVGI